MLIGGGRIGFHQFLAMRHTYRSAVQEKRGSPLWRQLGLRDQNEALRYSRTFTREAGNRLASLYAGMIMERERFKRSLIIAYFDIGAFICPSKTTCSNSG